MTLKEIRSRSKSGNPNILPEYSIWGMGVLQKISYYPSWIFLKIGFSANQVTYVSILVGILGCLFFVFGNYLYSIIGALLLNVWGVLDCVDGTIARYNGSVSEYGAFLDAFGGSITMSLLFLSLGIGTSNLLFGALTIIFYVQARSIFTLKEARRINFFRKTKTKVELLLKVGYNVTNATGVVFGVLLFSFLGILQVFLFLNFILSVCSLVVCIAMYKRSVRD